MRAASALLLLGALLAGQSTGESATGPSARPGVARPPDVADEPAVARLQDVPGPPDVAPGERAAAALFAELGARGFARPLFVVARLHVERGGRRTQLLLRIHVRGPGHVLVEVRELPVGAAGTRRRLDGTVFLQHEGRLHAWFPRAELQLALPVLLAGSRLCGSDIALDHLLAVAGDASRWRAADVTQAPLGDEPCQRLLLLPQRTAPGALVDTGFASQELLLARGPLGELLPRQLEGFDADGVLVSRVRLQSGDASGLPGTWTAQSLPPRPGAADDQSTLQLVHVERDPPVAPAHFLPEGLRAWR